MHLSHIWYLDLINFLLTSGSYVFFKFSRNLMYNILLCILDFLIRYEGIIEETRK